MRGGTWILTRNGWFAVGALAFLLALAVASGYQLAPGMASAAQHREQTPPAATPVPSTAQGAPSPASPRKGGAWLGIQIASADGGVRVEQVLPGSPAEKAALQRGDTITAVNGSAVASPNQLRERVTGLNAGDKVSLTVLRNGSSHTIEVILGAAPRRPQPPRRPASPGFAPFGGLGALVPELRDVPADQRFDHFRGGTFSFTDKNGNPITVNVTPGELTAVATDTITLRPNGGGADSSYRIANDTHVVPGGRAHLTDTMKAHDKVLVVSRQGSDEALAVFDQTAVKGHRGNARPHGSALPRPNGGQFGILPNGPLADQFRQRLDSLQQRFGQSQQRPDRQQSRPSS